MSDATHCALTADGEVLAFRVEARTTRDFIAEMLCEEVPLSEAMSAALRSHGPTADAAVRAFYPPGVIAEVVPAGELFRCELLRRATRP